MRLFTVRARRWARGWELHIEGVGVTQSRTLRDAKAMVRDYIALDLGKDIADEEIDLLPDLGGLEREVERARVAVQDAAEAQERAAGQSRKVARELTKSGLSGADAAVVLGVSPQRFSQLTKGSKARSGRSGSRKVAAAKSANKSGGRSTANASRSVGRVTKSANKSEHSRKET
jgi:predicted transcriptional regulator